MLNPIITNVYYCNNLTVGAPSRVTWFFRWLRLCQHQAACAQPEALGRTNRHLATKKVFNTVQIFNTQFLKIHMYITLAPLLPITLKFYFHALHKMSKYNFLESLVVPIASKFSYYVENKPSKMKPGTSETFGKRIATMRYHRNGF